MQIRTVLSIAIVLAIIAGVLAVSFGYFAGILRTCAVAPETTFFRLPADTPANVHHDAAPMAFGPVWSDPNVPITIVLLATTLRTATAARITLHREEAAIEVVAWTNAPTNGRPAGSRARQLQMSRTQYYQLRDLLMQSQIGSAGGRYSTNIADGLIIEVCIEAGDRQVHIVCENYFPEAVRELVGFVNKVVPYSREDVITYGSPGLMRPHDYPQPCNMP